MKQIFVITVLLFSGATSWAQNEATSVESLLVSPISYSVRELCPTSQICSGNGSVNFCPTNQMCLTNGTSIELNYEWPCGATLSSFNFEAQEKDGELHVYIKTEVAQNSQARCQGLIEESETLSLPNQFGKVVLHHLDNSPLRR